MQWTTATCTYVTGLATAGAMNRADVLAIIISAKLIMTAHTGGTTSSYLSQAFVIYAGVAYVLIGMAVKTGNRIGCACIRGDDRLNTNIA